MKKYLQMFAVAALITGAVSCSKDDDDDNPSGNIINFTATLNGTAEVPSTPSTATGAATATYNDNTNILTVTTTYTGMTVTAAHIHKGAVGVAGDVVFPITDLLSPMVLTTTALTAQQEADLKANLYYINLHSATYAGGEIRGQLMRQ